MIQARDLKIGNWVHHEGKPIKIYSLICTNHNDMYIGHMVNDDDWIEKYDPIPLTEDLIIKAGFTEGHNNYDFYIAFKRSRDDINYFESHLGLTRWSDGTIEAYIFNESFSTGGVGFSEDISLLHTDLKYLHQLQNFFYDLTSTELPIQL